MAAIIAGSRVACNRGGQRDVEETCLDSIRAHVVRMDDSPVSGAPKATASGVAADRLREAVSGKTSEAGGLRSASDAATCRK